MKAHRQEGRKCRKRRAMREMLLEKAKQQPPPPVCTHNRDISKLRTWCRYQIESGSVGGFGM
eukprot:1954031-Prymnesium_polylepis.1